MDLRQPSCMLLLRLASTIVTQSLQTVTNKLQRVLNAAVRVVSDTRKFDRGLTSLLHDELHWLDVPERVTYMYKMGVMMYRCLHDQAPHRYLADHFTTSSPLLRCRSSASSANRHQLIVPRCRLSLSSQHIMAVGCFRSPVRRSGTRCLTSSEIRRVVLTVLSSFLRQSCLLFIDVTSTLEVF